MNYRNLEPLAQTKQFTAFIETLNFKSLISNNQVFLANECILLHIYGYYTESIIYFDLYNYQNNTTCTDIGRLEWELNKEKIASIYDKHKKHSDALTTPAPSGTIEAESRFFARLEVMQSYLPDVLKCDNERYKHLFEPIPEQTIGKIDSVLDELGFKYT